MVFHLLALWAAGTQERSVHVYSELSDLTLKWGAGNVGVQQQSAQQGVVAGEGRTPLGAFALGPGAHLEVDLEALVVYLGLEGDQVQLLGHNQGGLQ